MKIGEAKDRDELRSNRHVKQDALGASMNTETETETETHGAVETGHGVQDALTPIEVVVGALEEAADRWDASFVIDAVFIPEQIAFIITQDGRRIQITAEEEQA